MNINNSLHVYIPALVHLKPKFLLIPLVFDANLGCKSNYGLDPLIALNREFSFELLNLGLC